MRGAVRALSSVSRLTPSLWRPCRGLVRFSSCHSISQQGIPTKDLGKYSDEYLRGFPTTAPIEAARTPSASWYYKPEFLELEKNAVFQKTWQPVGRIDQVAEVGQFFTGNLLGEPFVVVRDEKNELKAFFNVCRHHAAKIVDGCGKTQDLRCPYHGWTYTLDGRLKKATRLKGIKEFSAKEYGLLPIDVCTWGPFVWINMARSVDPNAKVLDLSEELKPLKGQLDETNWEKLKFVKRVSYDVDCNWKVYVENYCDGGYHVTHLHPNLGSMLDLNTYKTDIHKIYSVQYASAANDPNNQKNGVDFAERIGEKVVYGFIYPNFMINRYGSIMDTNYVIPLTTDKCRVIFDYYFLDTEGEANRKFIEDSLVASDKVQQEDMTICADVQSGVGTLAYAKTRGRYAPEVETPMYHFHTLLTESIAAAKKPDDA